MSNYPYIPWQNKGDHDLSGLMDCCIQLATICLRTSAAMHKWNEPIIFFPFCFIWFWDQNYDSLINLVDRFCSFSLFWNNLNMIKINSSLEICSDSPIKPSGVGIFEVKVCGSLPFWFFKSFLEPIVAFYSFLRNLSTSCKIWNLLTHCYS